MMRAWPIAAVVGLVILVGGAILLVRAPPQQKFIEYRMDDPQDAPIAIAAGGDGIIWFTIDHADAIGRLRDGRVERLATSSRNIEPLGLAVAADGSAWYTDIATRAIARVSHAGEIARFTLDTPIARLARLAIAPDGAVWFADPTGYGMTKLNDGVFSRRAIWRCGDRRRHRLGDAAERQSAAANCCRRHGDDLRSAARRRGAN